MTPDMIGWIGIGVFLILLIAGIPVGAALFLVGFFGYWVISGFDAALAAMGIMPYQNIATYSLTVIPLFIAMGHFAYHAGFATDVFDTAQKWIGRIPGGIVQATVAGAAAFGAACGSGMASCAIISKITIPEMLRKGVDRKLAFGAVASAGTLAAMIPPSICMIIYGIITNTPIGKLLIAGIIPGIVAALIFMITIYIMVKRDPSLVLSVVKVSWKDRFYSFRGAWGIALMALIIMGGIYTGIFTPIEAGAVGAFGAFVSGVVLKKFSWGSLKNCLIETIKTAGSILIIIAGAFLFTYFIGISRIPANASAFLTTLKAPGILIIISIMVMYIILGCFMDVVPTLFLTLPIIFPTVVDLGYNPIWFGVLITHIVEVGMITPPFGMNLFIVRGIISDSTSKEVIKGVTPFIIADMVTLAIYIAFPQLALFLPNMMS